MICRSTSARGASDTSSFETRVWRRAPQDEGPDWNHIAVALILRRPWHTAASKDEGVD